MEAAPQRETAHGTAPTLCVDHSGDQPGARCRRAIDAEGRTPTADILIILPNDKYGDGIMDDIRARHARLERRGLGTSSLTALRFTKRAKDHRTKR
jgi:hypothetical protein